MLYLETAEDQRDVHGHHSSGCHLNVSGLGPTLCSDCDGVSSVWRGRLDNMQCALRMCCAEGTIFRPFVTQFALLSPRAALIWDLKAFGKFMTESNTKRCTEAVVIGAGLRAALISPESSGSGVTHSGFACDEAMWEWAAEWIGSLRMRAGDGGGKVVSLLLDAAAPPLTTSTAAGALAARLKSATAASISDIIVIVGGPSGIPPSWRKRIAKLTGKSAVKVSLEGAVQHSAPALAEILMLHERHELVPLLNDRLALTAEHHKAWCKAERQVVHMWLRHLGVHADCAGATSASGRAPSRPAAEVTAELLKAHAAFLERMQ